ncbi:hypothetical protein EDC04DRAFT_2748929 [Pisolithus marmoratus]|nr:hypothetical protein EDC04DRAFT_2796492 [Pisolithus marmoratus]KAI6016504.1 hypothetical protein EDC04DRAFT_2748929 [Pisolithus marmoratus]
MLDIFHRYQDRGRSVRGRIQAPSRWRQPFEDLFHLTQPRSRLEDLVRHYGMCEGVVHITSSGVIGSSSTASLDSVASGSSRSKN